MLDEKSSDTTPLLGIEEIDHYSNYQIIRILLKEGWPFWLNRLVEVGVDFSAMSMLSQYNSDSQSAASLISSMCIILKSIDATFLYYTAQAVRERKNDRMSEVGLVLKKGWFFALPLSLFSISIALSSEPILKGLGQPAELAKIARNFLYPYAAGLPFILLTVVNQQVTLGIGSPKTVLVLTLLNSSIVLLLGYPLIFGKLKFPQMGAAGLGLAYMVSGVAHFISYLVLFRRSHIFTRYHLLNCTGWLRPDGVFTLLAHKGMGVGFYACLELGSSWMSTIFIGLNGKQALSAVQPAAQYASIIANLVFALGHTIGIMIIEQRKKSQFLATRKTAKIGILSGLGLPALVLIVFLATQDLMLRPFLGRNADDSVTNLASHLLLINLIGQLGDSLRNTGAGILRGFENTASPAFINTTTILLITIPCSVVAQFVLQWGPQGILSSRVLSMGLGGILILRKSLLESGGIGSAFSGSNLPSLDAFEKDGRSKSGCWTRIVSRFSIWKQYICRPTSRVSNFSELKR